MKSRSATTTHIPSTSFNSLFEMHEVFHLVLLALLLLSFNSLFEMQEEGRARAAGGDEGVTFNSLFEMRVAVWDRHNAGGRPFNSLFEMPK